MQRIVVLGAGSWGTAIAQTLSLNGHDVMLWCLEPAVAAQLTNERTNSMYLPGFQLHAALHVTTDLAVALDYADLIIEAIPVVYLRSMLQKIKQTYPAAARKHWLLLSKGLELQTHLLPTHILEDVFGPVASVSVLGGPSFAKDLMEQALTAVCVASTDAAQAVQIKALFENEFFKVELSDDVIGIQLGGALKNVLALATGIAHGAGMKDNTIAYMMTRGVAEMGMLMIALGGKHETMYGLAGFGDMILTCSSLTSKNFKAGMFLGKGVAVADLTNHMPVLPEGLNTCQALYDLLLQKEIRLPLLSSVYRAVYKGDSLLQLMKEM